MKIFVMIIVCFLWGVLSAVIADHPVSLIIAIFGGILIGVTWDKLWEKLR